MDLVRVLSRHGTLAQPGALELLKRHPDPIGLLQRAFAGSQPPLVLTVELARSLTGLDQAPAQVRPAEAARMGPAVAIEPRRVGPPAPLPRFATPHPAPASALEPRRDLVPVPEEVLLDVTGQSTCEGSIDDFVHLFNDRFQRMRRLFRRRRQLAGAQSIDKLRAGEEARIVGIVAEARDTKKGNRLLEIEDDTGSIPAIFSNNEHRMLDEAKRTMTDEVVGVVGKVISRGDNLLLASELYRPDLPPDHQARWGAEGVALFVSDVHVGSHTHLADAWEALIDWLNGRAGPRVRAEGSALDPGRVTHLFVVGDLVDGVGVYPGQEDELTLPDVMDQYAAAAHTLSRVPERIRVIISPGNHDAVRPAEPQPAFSQAIRELLPPRFRLVGNPCQVRIGEVETLLYHGVSLFDFLGAMPGLKVQHPLSVMAEMLRRRHLCPIYGGKTPLAPEHKDYLVIDRVPDVFCTGHVHMAEAGDLKGVRLVNSSCWQSQTSYQRMLGIVPAPCKAFAVDLATGHTVTLDAEAIAETGDTAPHASAALLAPPR